MFLELALPLLIALAWIATPRWRAPLTLAALATLLAIAVTFSRAGLVAAVAAIGVLAWVATRHRARTQLLLLLGVITLALPLAAGWGSLMDPGLDHRLLAGFDESSAQQPARIAFWAVAVDMFRNHPLLGVGPDNFRWLFAAYSDVAVNNLGIHAHDQYLESLADTGILGLATLAWLVTALTVAAVRGIRYAHTDWPWRAALFASLTAWLVHAVLDDFERFWPTNVVFWLIVGLVLCNPVDGRPTDQRLNSQ
jgi:O-antigen ligase